MAALLALAIVAGMLYVRGHRRVAPAASAVAPTSTVIPLATTSDRARYPVAAIAAASTSAPVPPGLGSSDGSDAGVRMALETLAGGQSLDGLLASDYLIQRIVAAVDALPHRQLAPGVLPLRGPSGSLVTRSSDGQVMIDPGNAVRYARYMRLLEAVDPQQAAAWYVRNYALFQQAYRQLGYPRGYFNDRLIEVIDHLLATPEPKTPPLLVRSKVLYEYADPALESLSAGQKMLLRTGTADEARIKAGLRAFRAAVTGATLPGAAASAAPG